MSCTDDHAEKKDEVKGHGVTNEWWTWLPDEVWDLVLNGTDSRGNALVDPRERVVLRAVCRRWRHVVGHPSPQWVDGHLATAWRMSPCSIGGGDALKAKFATGRVATFVGAVSFVCGSLACPPSTPDARPAIVLGRDTVATESLAVDTEDRVATPVRDGVERDRDGIVRRIAERLKAYTSLVARKERIQAGWRSECCLLIAYLVGQLDPLSAETQPEQCAARRIAPVLVALGRPHEALSFFERQFPVDVTNICASLVFVGGLFKVMRSLAYYGRDDVRVMTTALELGTRVQIRHTMQFERTCERHVLYVWRGLAQTCAIKCIRALTSVIQRQSGDAAHAAPFFPLLSGAAVVINPAHPICRVLAEARDRAETHFGTDYGDRYWLPDALFASDPVAVLEAHGPRAHDIKRVVSILTSADRYTDADPIVSSAIRAWGSLSDYVNASLMMHAIVKSKTLTDAIVWAARRGYVPCAGHVAQIVRARLLVLGADRRQVFTVVALLANTWPAQYMAESTATSHILENMIRGGRWRDADLLMRLLMPVALPTIGAFEKIDNVAPDSDDPSARQNDEPVVPVEWRVADGPARPSDSRPEYSVWAAILSGITEVSCLDERQGALTARPHRFQVLSKLIDHYDLERNSPMGAAWRFWCGPPTRFSIDKRDHALIRLAHHGLVV